MTQSDNAVREVLRYRKRPVMVDAFRLGHDAMPEWFLTARSENIITTYNFDGRWCDVPAYAIIKTLEGRLQADYGDWIIRGVKGEIYSCKPDIFALTYELASPEAPAAVDDKRRTNMARKCCFVGCDAPAEFELWPSNAVYEFVDSCETHVGALIDDAPETRVMPLGVTPPAPQGTAMRYFVEPGHNGSWNVMENIHTTKLKSPWVKQRDAEAAAARLNREHPTVATPQPDREAAK